MDNFIKKFRNRIKGLHKSRLVNPHVHWAILIRFSLTISFFLIIFGFYLLYKVKNEQIFQFEPTLSENSPSLIKEDLLEKVNEEFKKKELRSLDVNNGVISFPDPSF